MKRLLLPLIAALALPTAVKANESPYYLVIGSNNVNLITIPMESKGLCDQQLEETIDFKKNWSKNPKGGAPWPNGMYGKCIKSKL